MTILMGVESRHSGGHTDILITVPDNFSCSNTDSSKHCILNIIISFRNVDARSCHDTETQICSFQCQQLEDGLCDLQATGWSFQGIVAYAGCDMSVALQCCHQCPNERFYALRSRSFTVLYNRHLLRMRHCNNSRRKTNSVHSTDQNKCCFRRGNTDHCKSFPCKKITDTCVRCHCLQNIACRITCCSVVLCQIVYGVQT